MGNEAIDVATFRSLQESAGAGFVSDLVGTFLEEAPRMLATLRDAFRSGDDDAFRRAAHTLKSNGLTFGAIRLAAMARGLEQDAKSVVAGTDSARLDAVATEYERVATALAELRHA